MRENVLLSEYTTFRIGGPARFFSEVENEQELCEAILFARAKKMPIFVLGAGSNLLVSDKGFDGLVIKVSTKGVVFEEVPGSDFVRVIAKAGENWDSLVEKTVERGLYGLENLSGIPSSIGAAPVQNIGAYGSEAEKNIEWVEAIDSEAVPKTGKAHTARFTKNQCEFSYRNSFFKKPEGKKYVITTVCFLLSKKGNLNTSYKDIEEYAKEKKLPLNSVTDVRRAILDVRANKLPDIKKVGTAGSFFVNPIISIREYRALQKKFTEISSFPVGKDKVKISLAWILDHALGMKGYKRGAVGVHEKQALVIVNFGGGTAHEVYALSNDIKKMVKEKTGISISPEVEFIGDFMLT